MDPKTAELHARNKKLLSEYRDLEGKLIDSLQEFDRHRGFQKMGFPSLFSYCRDGLGMSENQAFTLIRVSRKAVEVPALREALVRKEITLSSARLIAPVITKENQEEWLEKARTLPKPALERELVKENPKAIRRDRILPLTPLLSEARGVLSLEAKRILDRVKEIESKRICKPCDLDAAIIAMGRSYLMKNDPVEKADRIESRKRGPGVKLAAGTPESPAGRQAKFKPMATRTGPGDQLREVPLARQIPAQVIHQVNARDRGRCQMRQQGKLCGSRHFSQIHHIRPFQQGGKHSLDNLVTLCGGHHRSLHAGGMPPIVLKAPLLLQNLA